jgi:hypothetical protein
VAGKFYNPVNDFVFRKAIRIDFKGVRGFGKRGIGPPRIPGIARAHLLDQFFHRNFDALIPVLQPTASGAFLDTRNKKNFEFSIRHYYSLNVSAFHNDPAAPGKFALQLHQGVAHPLQSRDGRGKLGYLRGADSFADVFIVQKNALDSPLAGLVKIYARALGQVDDSFGLGVGFEALARRKQRNASVKSARIYIGEPEASSHLAGDRTLARPDRPIEGDPQTF